MSTLSDGLTYVESTASNISKGVLGNPVTTAIGGAVLGGAIVGTTIALTSSRKKKTRKKSSRRGVQRRSARRSKKRNYKYARTAGKRKDTSTRRIRMTKNGQPYVIMKSGKARFISKSSARLSRKRKGGRY